MDHVRIAGKRADERAGEDQEHQCRGGHERHADADRRPAGARDAVRILASDRVADANRGGRGQAERNHERERRHVQHDLMRGQRVSRHARGKRGRCRKDADFEHRLPGRRQPEPEQGALTREIEMKRRVAERRFPIAVTPQHHEPQPRGHEHARQQRRPGRSADAQRRQTEMTVDQHPVGERVDDIGRNQRDHDGTHDAQALKVATKSHVEKKRRKAPGQNRQIRTRERQHPGRQAPPGQRRRHREQDGEHRNGDQRAQPHAIDQPAVALVEPGRTKRLGDQRIESEQQAHRKDRDGEEEHAGEADGADSVAPSPPTMIVSTIPMVTQPSSARTTGVASASIGPKLAADHSDGILWSCGCSF